MPPTIIHPTKSFIDSLTIDGGHTIMTSNVPEKIGAQQFVENYYGWKKPTPEAITQFGLFGSDLNYHTYYPDVTPEELQPKGDEFIYPIFRLLSATIVSKNWNPTDFGHIEGVLKSSMSLLLGQTVNCDHSTDVGNAIGSVSEVLWQEGYKDGKIVIPAGINGVLKIDGKANPRIARGILMEPPSIHSNSVTVQFKWEQSHPDMSISDFWDKLGTYDSKGQLIRRIVTEIIRYHETSLVSHGADPYAQKITQDGKLNNPIFADRTWQSYSEYTEAKNKIYTFEDYKEVTNDTPGGNNKGGNSSQTENSETNNSNPKTDMDKDLQQFLASLFGEGVLTLAEGAQPTTEGALEAIRALVEAQANHQGEITALNETVTNLTTERDQLTNQVTELNAKVAGLEAMATIGTNYVAQLREEAVANYRKVKGDQADDTIINMLQATTTGLQTLISLNKDYKQQLEEKFPMHCQKCGSTEISRANSKADTDEEGKGGEGQESNTEKSTSDALRNIYNSKLK